MNLLDFSVVHDYGSVFLQGLAVTTFLTVVVILLAGVLAIPIALARLSPRRWIRWPADFYVEFIRATPLILQLIYIYYVLPSAGIRLEPMTAAIIGLTVNYSAFMSEVYRSGIQAVPRSQYEAAQSLGLKPTVTFVKVIFPQAFRVVLPALGNYLIALFKDTALASVVTVQELMFSGQIIAARNYQYFTVYTVTAILYFSVGYPAALLVRRLERWSQRGWASASRK
ncbi:polar amino acid transport system permease protein [Angulomicrobium tetraedrale]|uniref:Polar amino acid transport system permease protein n=1 Tax=Ancylobacter tetraedralis TaxID=217068 RepID=A0A839ZCP9_9HYPH|nr:amino acid ABC transporter permease [Ancylobacter tetraedralis]MBB3772563.1 polar amino acid transport system permease protein [Ancylobacter tetraedralis]